MRRVTLSRASRLSSDEAAGAMRASLHPGSADGSSVQPATRRSSGGSAPGRWCWREAGNVRGGHGRLGRHRALCRQWRPRLLLTTSSPPQPRSRPVVPRGPSTAAAGSGGHIRQTRADVCWSSCSTRDTGVVSDGICGARILPTWSLATGRFSTLGGALRTMKDQLGVTCVVSEAGGGLNGALLRSELVDELHLDAVAVPGRRAREAPTILRQHSPCARARFPTRLRLLDAGVTTTASSRCTTRSSVGPPSPSHAAAISWWC